MKAYIVTFEGMFHYLFLDEKGTKTHEQVKKAAMEDVKKDSLEWVKPSIVGIVECGDIHNGRTIHIPYKIEGGRVGLSEKLETLILMATKQAGTYDPNQALTYIEEQLTMHECKLTDAFLKWVHENKKTFGHGNIKTVWAEFHDARGIQ